MPLAIGAPVLNRVASFPSSALAGTSPLSFEAVATHPVRGSAVSFDPPSPEPAFIAGGEPGSRNAVSSRPLSPMYTTPFTMAGVCQWIGPMPELFPAECP